jgi:N-acetylmuramoyl-L-alanine amidase
MRAITVVDPGHGGTTAVGQSTPFGVRGLNGLVEKNVALDLSQRVAQRLGTSVFLTRYGDVNLSLDDRARLARDLGAPAFLSLHGTAGGGGAHGSETWIHSHAGPASIALAEEVRDELGRLGIPDRGVHRGELAVLNPRRHRNGCAACLVEVEHLDDQNGARLLSNPRALDAVADGLARGVDRYLSRPDRSGSRAYAFGRPYSIGLDEPLDLTDFPTNVFTIVPDTATPTVPRQIRQSDHDALERAWDCMMKGSGLTVDGPVQRINGVDVDLASQFRVLLRGGLADSPLIRDLFREIACDTAHPLTFHIRRDFPGMIIDGFQFDPTNPDPTIAHPGHHSFDLADFDQLPRVSGNPRNDMMTSLQNLLHGLREARQGVLFTGAGNPFPTSHTRAIDDENLFRREQGQRGTLLHTAPIITPTATGGEARWEFMENNAAAVVETWHLFVDGGTGSISITSIDY